jgi:hypothetical protein
MSQVSARLWEVAEVLTLRAQLLAVEPEMIRVAQHLLEDEARLLQIAQPRQKSPVSLISIG